MLHEMPATLRSTGENGAREYELLAPLVPNLDPSRGEIFLGRRVAPPDLSASVIVKHAPHNHDLYPELRERLLDEALETSSAVHPNMSTVADVIENDDGIYLVLEHVDGTDLESVAKRLLERKQALSFELIAFIISEVLKAMQQLHTARDANGKQLLMVLRDVTPANVLISATGRVKLANRSLADALEKKRRRSAPQLFAYFAPECIAGEPFTIASDVYGIGVMLWELLVGRRCFAGETKNDVLTAILRRGVPIADLHLGKVPSRLVAVVERATAFVPERRFQSASDMARALEGFLRETAETLEMTPLLAHFLSNARLLSAPTDSGPQLAAGANVRLLPALATPVEEMEPEPIDPAILAAADELLVDLMIDEVHDTEDLSVIPIPEEASVATVVSVAPQNPVSNTPTPSSMPGLSDRDRRTIAVRTMRSPERTSMPPAAFSERQIPAEEKPKDVKSRTLLWLIAVALAVVVAIIVAIEQQQSRLDELDRATEHATPVLRDPSAPSH